MQKRGFTTVEFDEPSDVYVINTCSVTEQADTKCRNIVRKAMKQNPDAYVVVVGCYAQLKPKEIAAAVLYFASDESAFTTGQIMEVSGGFGLPTPVFGDMIEKDTKR